MISPPVKKAKKSEETGCDNTKDPRISSGGEDEKLEIPVGGEEAIAAVVNRAAEEGGFSCISEEKKGFVFEADVAEDKGVRHAMEDVSVVLPDASLDFPGKLRCAHFSIYDGHGGRLAAEFAKKHLHLNVLSAGLPRLLWCHSLSRSYFTFFLALFFIQMVGCCFRWISKLLRKPYLMVSGKPMSCSCKKVFHEDGKMAPQQCVSG
ncbi:hypothetical protein Bca52824_008166 [Brassica carinata]|uniref:Uncharacterized protein n=1 Tax=Brassica carinata TaxID=52824 RepID=A0A8X7WBF6_BRACI|nr:hypothetical protein Bca52824_008166 [Brassica carinata]